jgi:hypothetical protein
MKIVALFDKSGNIHALFHPSSEPDAPKLYFRPRKGQRAETLEVPSELRHLKPGQLHAAVKVDLRGGVPHLVARTKSKK